MHKPGMALFAALVLGIVLCSGPVLAQEPATSPAVSLSAQAMPVIATPAGTAGASLGRPDAAAPAVVAAPSGSLLQVLFGLVAVLGLLAAVLWILKRVGAKHLSAGSIASIVGGVAVGSRERVLVLQVSDQWIVVGVAPGQVTHLASMPRQEEMDPAAASPSPNFSSWLKQMIEKRNAA